MKNCTICSSKLETALDRIGGICLDCADTNLSVSEQHMVIFEEETNTKQSASY